MTDNQPYSDRVALFRLAAEKVATGSHRLTKPARLALNQVLRDGPKMGGHRDLLKAPRQMVIKCLADCAERSVAGQTSLLRAWTDLSADTLQLVLDGLKTAGQSPRVPGRRFGGGDDVDPDYSRLDELATEIAGIAAPHCEDVNPDDVRLASWSLALDLMEVAKRRCVERRPTLPSEVAVPPDETPPPEEAEHCEQAPSGDNSLPAEVAIRADPRFPGKLQTFLNEVSQLAPNAAEVEALPELIERLSHLVADKRRELLRQESRAPLSKAFESMREVANRFSELDLDTSLWQPDACPDERIAEIASKIAELLAALKEYERTLALQASSFVERMANQQAVLKAMAQLSEAHVHLAALFQPRQTDPTPPRHANGRMTAATEPALAPIASESEAAKPADTPADETVATAENRAAVVSSAESDAPIRPVATVSVSTEALEAAQERIESNSAETVTATIEDPVEVAAARDTAAVATAQATLEATIEAALEPTLADVPVEPTTKATVPDAPVLDRTSVGSETPVAPSIPVSVRPLKVRKSTSQSTSKVRAEGTATPATDVAFTARVPDDANTVDAIWRAIGVGDLAGASWLAQSLDEQSPVPAPFLELCAAASWLRGEPSRVESEILARIQDEANAVRLDLQGIAVATALLPALTNPNSGLASWLAQLPPPFGEANRVIDAVREFAPLGYPLAVDAVSQANDLAQTEAETANRSKQLCEWLDISRQRNLKLHSTEDTLQTVLRSNPLSAALEIVAANHWQKVEAVDQILADLGDRASLVELVRNAENENSNKKKISVRQVVGGALEQLLGLIEEAIECARAWCFAARRWSLGAKRGEWLDLRVRNLVDEITATAPAAIEALRALALMSDTTGDRATAQRLADAIDELASYVRGESRLRVSSPLSTHGIGAGLAFRLVQSRLSPLSVGDDGYPTPDDVKGGAFREALSQPALGIDETLEFRCDQLDLRWSEELLRASLDAGHAQERVRAAVVQARERVNARLQVADTLLEEAVVEGTVDDDARSRISSSLQDVRDALQAGRFVATSLEEQVSLAEADVSLSRDTAVEIRRVLWGELSFRASQSLPTEFGRLEMLVQDALGRRNLYQLDEILSGVRLALAGDTTDAGKTLHDLVTVDTAPSEPDYLAEFIRDRDAIGDFLFGNRAGSSHGTNVAEVIRAIRNDKSAEILRLKGLPTLRRGEVLEGLSAWRDLRQAEGYKPPLDSKVGVILSYLGFRVRPSTTQKIDSGKDWVLWTVQVASADSAPVPQYGSGAAAGLPVLCLWDRPAATVVDSILKEARIDRRPMIILFLGRLQSRQRDEYARRAVTGELESLLLDEVLLLFLAQFYTNRLRAFFNCALPFAYVNPYVAGTAATVPSEMFFGRRSLLRDLERASGTCLVYGGRQLGKSSALRHLQRSFHNPDREQYSFYDDIRTLVGPASASGPEVLWMRLAEGFARVGLFDKEPPVRPDAVERAIRKAMTNPSRRVIALFDEADDFLTADAQKGFAVVSRIKALMDETDRRFKVVFAGLHNVRRFASIPNQPLAHLGIPAKVGPLDPADAQDLIKRPMQALGFRFPEPQAPLEILSRTNYHPGLIQHFCKSLVLHLLKQHARTMPHSVTVADVQEVYRDQTLRQEIRAKFLLTLNLDPRYGVLVRSIILEQSGKDGHSRGYSVPELRALGETWWPRGFRDLTDDHLRDYLQELVDLWVFAADRNGKFGLRSPNVVRLLGTTDEIQTELLRYRQDDPEAPEDPWRNPDGLHMRVSDEPPAYSPLTQGQFRRLGLGTTGLTVIFGNTVTGIDTVPTALAHAARVAGMAYASISTIGIALAAKQALSTLPKNSKESSAVLVGALPCDNQLAFVNGMWKNLASLRQDRARVILLADSRATTLWAELSETERTAAESHCAILTLAPWTENAIARWLDETGLINSGISTESARAATGGYHACNAALLDSYSVNSGASGTALLARLTTDITDRETVLGKRVAAAFTLVGTQAEAARTVCSLTTESDALSLDMLLWWVAETAQLSGDGARRYTDLFVRMGLFERLDDGRLRVNTLARNAVLA